MTLPDTIIRFGEMERGSRGRETIRRVLQTAKKYVEAHRGALVVGMDSKYQIMMAPVSEQSAFCEPLSCVVTQSGFWSLSDICSRKIRFYPLKRPSADANPNVLKRYEEDCVIYRMYDRVTWYEISTNMEMAKCLIVLQCAIEEAAKMRSESGVRISGKPMCKSWMRITAGRGNDIPVPKQEFLPGGILQIEKVREAALEAYKKYFEPKFTDVVYRDSRPFEDTDLPPPTKEQVAAYKSELVARLKSSEVGYARIDSITYDCAKAVGIDVTDAYFLTNDLQRQGRIQIWGQNAEMREMWQRYGFSILDKFRIVYSKTIEKYARPDVQDALMMPRRPVVEYVTKCMEISEEAFDALIQYMYAFNESEPYEDVDGITTYDDEYFDCEPPPEITFDDVVECDYCEDYDDCEECPHCEDCNDMLTFSAMRERVGYPVVRLLMTPPVGYSDGVLALADREKPIWAVPTTLEDVSAIPFFNLPRCLHLWAVHTTSKDAKVDA